MVRPRAAMEKARVSLGIGVCREVQNWTWAAERVSTAANLRLKQSVKVVWREGMRVMREIIWVSEESLATGGARRLAW
jgi:hypothetical protein